MKGIMETEITAGAMLSKIIDWAAASSSALSKRFRASAHAAVGGVLGEPTRGAPVFALRVGGSVWQRIGALVPSRSVGAWPFIDAGSWP